MIAIEQQTPCKVCGTLITQRAGKGHRKRIFCSPRCKQADYRQHHHVKSNVTFDATLQTRIAELEQALDLSQQNVAVGKEKLGQAGSHIQKLERQVEIQKQRLRELTGELATSHQVLDLSDRAKLEARFMHLGEQVGYHPLTTLSIFGGFGYWQDFMNHANNETLLKAIAAAEYYLEGLIALRGDPRERRITELEQRIAELEHENARIVEQAGLLKHYRDDQAPTSPKKARGKKRGEPVPLPAELVYWRRFANNHGIAQNALTDAVSRGFIHLVQGAWKMESGGYVTQALDARGQHEFWIQFHASDTFRTCDTCPH
jgi:endogenous inhibitor of DNA gyrase (YacG/DUF329 family)